MNSPVLRVGLVARRGDELLLVRRGHGAAAGEWGLPGCPVRAGETLAEAVVSAAEAQTGVDALCGPFLGWTEQVESNPASLWMCFDSVTLGERDRPAPEGLQPDDERLDGVLEHEWVHLEVVAERRLDEGLADFLAEHGVIDTVV